MNDLIYVKNSNDVVFKQLVDGSYQKVPPMSSEFEAWLLINKEVPLDTSLDNR